MNGDGIDMSLRKIGRNREKRNEVGRVMVDSLEEKDGGCGGISFGCCLLSFGCCLFVGWILVLQWDTYS